VAPRQCGMLGELAAAAQLDCVPPAAAAAAAAAAVSCSFRATAAADHACAPRCKGARGSGKQQVWW
jgi:hypothetical protein